MLKNLLQALFTTFDKHGKKLYIVGGSLRDMLIGKKTSDYDFTTDALPTEVESYFEKTVPLGKGYGTIGVLLNETLYEITSMREEDEYRDSRHPDVVIFTDDPQKDVQRRDFTINALLMDTNGAIYDYVGGLKDIEKRLIKTVGDPQKRFREDSLRKWRAIRFVSETSFSLEGKTLKAIIEDPSIDGVSAERINKELSHILLGDNVTRALQLLSDTGLYTKLWESFGEINPPAINISGYNTIPKDIAMRIFVMCRFFSERQTKTFLEKLKFPRSLQEEVFVYKHHISLNSKDIIGYKTVIAALEEEKTDKLFFLQMDLARKRQDKNACQIAKENKKIYREIIERKHPLNVKDLAISGDVLYAKGYRGKAIGECLDKILNYVYLYPQQNTVKALLKYLKREKNGKINLPKNHRSTIKGV